MENKYKRTITVKYPGLIRLLRSLVMSYLTEDSVVYGISVIKRHKLSKDERKMVEELLHEIGIE